MQQDQLIEVASSFAPEAFAQWLARQQPQPSAQHVEAMKAAAEARNDEGRLEEALDLLDRAALVAQATGDPLAMGLVWRGRANVLQMAERFEEGLAAASQAEEIYQRHGTALDVAIARTVEVYLLGALERFDEAVALAHEIRATFEEANFGKGLAFLASNLGKVHTMAWQLEPALQEYRRARRLFLKLGLSGLAAEVLHNMGVAAYYLDRLELARRYYDKSYCDLVAAGDLYTALKAQMNLAQLCQREGNYEQALAHVRQARTDCSHLSQAPDLAYINLFEGTVRQALGQRDQAQSLFRQAVAQFDRLGRRIETAQALMALGHSLVQPAAPEQILEGLACLERAEQEIKGFDVPLFQAWLWLLQAECLLALDRGFEAAERTQPARHVFAQAGLDLRQAQADAVLGDCCWQLQPRDARQHYLTALQANADRDLLISARCQRGLGRLAVFEGRYDAAEGFYERAMTHLDEVRRSLASHAHQSGFLDDKQTLTEELLAALQKEPGSEARLSRWVERIKAQALADLLLNRPLDLIVDEQTTQLLTERRRLREQYDSGVRQRLENGERLVAARQQRGPAVAAFDLQQGQKLAELRRLLRSLDEKLASQCHPAVAWHTRASIELGDLCQLLDKQTVLISYYGIHGQLHALTVTDSVENCQSHSLKIGVAEVEAQWQRAYRQIIRPDSRLPELQARLARLWNGLIAPLEPRLSTYEHVVILPYRRLSQIPFAALFDPGTGRYLIERWTVQMAPSATVWAHCRTLRPGTRPPLLVGYPGLPEEKDYLPGVAREITLVSEVIPSAEVLVGEDATPQRVVDLASARAVIHLACHAAVDQQDPLQSGLRLADGRWLRVADLYQLYDAFAGSTVLLSGCNTSQGQLAGQDVLGLVSAFLYAGASCVVAGLWRLDDTATVDWMQAFYGDWVASSNAFTAARKAQLAALEDPIQRHPYFWAPFAATGDGGTFTPGGTSAL